MKSRAKNQLNHINHGGAAEGRPPMIIIFSLALALGFTLGSKVYPSVKLELVVVCLPNLRPLHASTRSSPWGQGGP